jgi:pimeloyl-ACP methyl ester carboxylesterase
MSMLPYRPVVAAGSFALDVRGVSHHVRTWGRTEDPPLLMLHGWLDNSATFQFLVDSLMTPRYCVAPDWRGFGSSGWTPDGYAFEDYLADLDQLSLQLFAGRPVPILGHSMGGNVAGLYAGVRPQRVSHLISLDGFGLPDGNPADAPARLRSWLDGTLNVTAEQTYADLGEVADKLRVRNPRLAPDKALYLASQMTKPVPGGFQWLFDPAHRVPFARGFDIREWEACMRELKAPTLWIAPERPSPPPIDKSSRTLSQRIQIVRATFRSLKNSGHNLQHDVPREVATLVEAFLENSTRFAQ